MKTAEGFWMTKSGYQVNFATQIYQVTAKEDSLTAFVTTQWIQNRGMTLGGPALTIRFSSPAEDTVMVSIDHYTGEKTKKPEYALYKPQGFHPTVQKNGDCYELVTGNTRVVLGAEGGEYKVEYYYKERLLTKSGWRTTAIIEEEAWKNRQRIDNRLGKPFFAIDENEGSTYLREMLNIAVGEYIYGLGEKFTSFVKNGQTATVWNNDGGTCSEQSYKSVPFFVSSRGYGVFVNHPEKVEFEVASETVSKTAFSVQGEHLEYFLFGGGTIADVLRLYTDLTGKPALVPAYTFGLWLSTSFTTQYDEKTVMSFVDEMERRGIPLEVFHFDCFWMKEFSWCGFAWDERMFPDPAGMLKRLKQRGLKISLWVNPYIGQQAECFAECAEKGYFIKKKDGSVFQCDMWQPGLAIVDFTNPQAYAWYQGKIKALLEMGIDAIKTDFGERIPTDVVYYDGSDPYRMHNYYSYLYNKAVFEAAEEVRGKGNACVFARSATAGCQQFPVHWGGDCFSDYESMWETLRGGLSLCMSGFGFFSHDISGFEETGSPDLYKRWTAFGLLSTHSRYHGNSSYRVPWNFDEESCLVSRHFVNLKGKLMPYLYANAVETHQSGVPMMRALAIDFGQDRSALTVDTEYMLGDSLMVAPVFREDGVCDFYLPGKGVWTDIQTGEEKEGGSWYTQKYDYFGLPLYAKPNSILVFGAFEKSVEYDYAENATYVIYGLEDGKSASRTVYDTEGRKVFTLTAGRKGDTVFVETSGEEKQYHVVSAQKLKLVLPEK